MVRLCLLFIPLKLDMEMKKRRACPSRAWCAGHRDDGWASPASDSMSKGAGGGQGPVPSPQSPCPCSCRKGSKTNRAGRRVFLLLLTFSAQQWWEVREVAFGSGVNQPLKKIEFIAELKLRPKAVVCTLADKTGGMWKEMTGLLSAEGGKDTRGMEQLKKVWQFGNTKSLENVLRK